MAPKKKPARTPDEQEEAEEHERPGAVYDENDPELRGGLAEHAERFVSESWGYSGPDE